MVDLEIVCCMCGDVGFSDKLFRCTKCHYRFQHSYCSNYYGGEAPERVEKYCDWCQSEEVRSSSSRRSSSSSLKSNTTKLIIIEKPPEYSSSAGEKEMKVKSNDNEKGKTTTTPSPRPTTRRYKLLKDVMSS